MHGTHYPVVIIGAGPAGVAAAATLAERDIEYIVLERGPAAFAGLRRIDPTMRLLSPKSVSRLPGMQQLSRLETYPTFEAYIDILERYRESRQIRPLLRTEVISVSRSGNRFEIKAIGPDGSSLEFTADHVVNATGIISTPRLPPAFNPERSRFRWKHSLDVRALDLASARRLLVVGGGASAAEVLDRWLEVRSPADRARLSLRSRLRAFVNPILGIDVHYWVWLPEQFLSWPFTWRAGRLAEPMSAAKVLPAIDAGLITLAPGVFAYQEDEVVFHSGERFEPDLVVFATGMDYAVPHLRGLLTFDPDGRPLVCCCESTATRNLYLLGFKFGRTFASPYIRGIARDAAYVAGRIARRLAHASASS
jgi:cation diffusion facilitator CzcD-associated flavoprotein CzcO